MISLFIIANERKMRVKNWGTQERKRRDTLRKNLGPSQAAGLYLGRKT
jgi:hypothetical protein